MIGVATIGERETSVSAAGEKDVRVATARRYDFPGCGSAEVDAETEAAALQLRSGRIGYRVAKRAFDVVFSACVLVCLSWLFLIIAVAIKLDDPVGPVLFSQVRVGRDGREFRMWKFRSMVKDADRKLEELLDRNEVEGPMFKMADDPRVTRIGRFIRRHSIDEFPQFINVLLGQMSVVGPRPPLPREVEQYDEWAMQRLAVKPGLTGPWQVGGRSDVDFDDMVRLDLGYIARRSVKTDMVIILQTVAVVFTGKGAH